jgi:predicted regulator of Ras-like GTPase activity (Roadblock/LC7/MglB family)
MLQETLETIVAATPGAQAAVLMGFDGIAVVQVTGADADADIEAIAMEFSFRFIELRKAAEALDLGDITDLTIKAERGTLLVRVISEEFFACVFLRDTSHLGKGRYVLRTHSAALREGL